MLCTSTYETTSQRVTLVEEEELLVKRTFNSFLMHQIFHFLKVVNTMAYVKLLNSQFLFLLLQIAYTKYVQVVSLDFCTNWLLIPVCRPCNVIKLKTR